MPISSTSDLIIYILLQLLERLVWFSGILAVVAGGVFLTLYVIGHILVTNDRKKNYA